MSKPIGDRQLTPFSIKSTVVAAEDETIYIVDTLHRPNSVWITAAYEYDLETSEVISDAVYEKVSMNSILAKAVHDYAVFNLEECMKEN